MKPTPSDDPKATGPESLTFTLHDTPAPMRDYSAAQSRRGRITMLVILFACALPVIASYFTYYVIRPGGRTNYATLIEPQRPLPSLDAVPAQDMNGHSVPLTTLKGQWLMIVVAPAGCGKLCESNLFLQRQLREMMGAERDRIQKVWLVDSSEAVEPALAAAVAAPPAVATYRVERSALAGWLEPEAHHQLEESLYIVDPLGNWMMRTPANPDPVKLKKDVDKLLRASAWWNRAKDTP
ncbi:hypothetical protein [Scleromatobacter humisilvae]|uniref:Cytochrome oxidase Cu insertion factor, SCO1/SenC/PrrC family n=1 Tax=Scleromatobacter humisilvae TaxID=2897159 RepID=A0A9X1YLZ4_9BURK|nr:hypothetical protein [Scleromatobacter humisilvae]MCK9688406.1 hypothetical protein [Scleromatobacter humisilvae]